jgi:Holliday junction resolvase-like predicted endonuclease
MFNWYSIRGDTIIPSVKDIFKAMDRVREVHNRTGSVGEALKARGILTSHEVIRVIVGEKLKRMGYRIVGRDEAPEFIRRVGSPDVIAERGGSWFIVEVKPLDQLVRYEEVGVKLILVTNVRRGKFIEIWGLEELEGTP